MKAMRKVLVAALAAAGLATAGTVLAAPQSGGHSGGHWSGGHSGHWSGGHWGGRHWGGHSYWRPGWGFYFGVPVIAAWGWPYYYDYWYDYPRDTIVYREVERMPWPEANPPTTEVQPAPGAPSQGPAYMNYCESAKAYYPKVTQCPEGWRFLPAR